MIPEWITWAIPFVSGAAGVYAGLRVGLAKLEANYCNLHSDVLENREKLKYQVGEQHCREMRQDCQRRLDTTLNRIEATAESNRQYVASKLDDVARELVKINVWMAKRNGD